MLLVILMLSPGCVKTPEPVGYRVVGYKEKTHEWIILHNGIHGGKHMVRRLTAVCIDYRGSDDILKTGSDACRLEIGRLLVPSSASYKGNPEEYLNIDESGPALLIVEGYGPGQVTQQLFKIVKSESLPDLRAIQVISGVTAGKNQTLKEDAAIPIGTHGFLSAGDIGRIPMARTERDWQQMHDAVNKKDTISYLCLIDDGSVFLVTNGSRVTVIDAAPNGLRKVHVIDGHEGWIRNQLIQVSK